MQHATEHDPATAVGSVDLPQIGDQSPEPIRMCLVVGGDPAFQFACEHSLPVRTYCGAWFTPDVVTEAEAVIGETVDCALCDLAYDVAQR